MTDEEAVARAHRSYNDLTEVAPIFERLRGALIDRWSSTSVTDTATREKMFNAYSTIHAVEKALKEAVDAGRVSEFALRQAELLAPAR